MLLLSTSFVLKVVENLLKNLIKPTEIIYLSQHFFVSKHIFSHGLSVREAGSYFLQVKIIFVFYSISDVSL